VERQAGVGERRWRRYIYATSAATTARRGDGFQPQYRQADWHHVVRSEHSEVGEGKGGGYEVQDPCAAVLLDAREDQPRVHQHLFDQLEEARGSGDFNVLGEIDRSLFKKGNPGAIPVQIQCQCVVYHKNNGITLHEFFGIGIGKRVSEEELKKFGHYGVSESSSGSLSQAEDGGWTGGACCTRHTRHRGG